MVAVACPDLCIFQCAANAESRATGAHETAQGIAESVKTIRYEHYKLLLGHADDMELLAEAANALAQAKVPCDIADGVALTRMTGIRKPGGGVQMTRMSRAMCARPKEWHTTTR